MKNPYKDIAPEDILRIEEESNMNEEEVKKILEQRIQLKGSYRKAYLSPNCIIGLTSQICQLFEPKFNNALEADAHSWDTRELLEPKPDDRLLTDEETQRARGIGGQAYTVAVQTNTKIPSLDACCNRSQNRVQDAKTASILKTEYDKLVTEAQDKGYKLAEAECSKKIEEIFRGIEDIVSQEEELQGDMPNDIWGQLQDRENAVIVLRAIVRATKKNIIKGLQALEDRIKKEKK